MRERSELILKIVCGVLGGLLLFQLARLVIHSNPLRGVNIPELPTLPASLDATNGTKGSNVVAGKIAGTNITNSVTSKLSGEKGTNATTTNQAAVAGQVSSTNATNSVTSQKSGEKDPDPTIAQAVNAGQVSSTNTTNSVTSQKPAEKETNSSTSQASAKTETNPPANSARPAETNSAPTQVSKSTETNSFPGQAPDKTKTNASPGMASEKTGTNAVSTRPPGYRGPQSGMSQLGMTKMPELPPIIQARIDKIAQSEILAPFPRRMPMALLGVAGKDAFLRAPSGQTGLVKEGDELGGIKLLQIGVNRVLVEQEGEKKELTIFSGLGGESLLPKPKPATNETIIKSK